MNHGIIAIQLLRDELMQHAQVYQRADRSTDTLTAARYAAIVDMLHACDRTIDKLVNTELNELQALLEGVTSSTTKPRSLSPDQITSMAERHDLDVPDNVRPLRPSDDTDG